MLDQILTEAQASLTQLNQAAQRLQDAVDLEIRSKRDLTEAQTALSNAEAAVVFSLETQAQAKTGPLSGLAKTSPAYKAAITAYVAEASEDGGPLSGLATDVAHFADHHMNAQIEREEAAVAFSAAKYGANLLAAMLNASR